ncbi:MAG: HAMP domain-containing histidine kinase [Pirellulales bacterium]|nr:HAMP domain-containing histidine kinase [Pirellulales bacterium]
MAETVWAAYDLPLQVRTGSEPVDAPPTLAESDDLILLQNEAWFCTLRWLVIAALCALALAGWATTAAFPLPGIRLDPLWPPAVAAVLLFLNLTYLAMIRKATRSARRSVLAERGLWLQIGLDLAVLTVVVHFLGSLDTFAPFMYLFHIVLACIFLPYAQSLLVTLLAMGMYLICLILEGTGAVAPQSVLIGAMCGERAVSLTVAAWQFGSVAFVSATVWYLASRLSRALRQRDAELSAINRRLVAATEERAGHMLQTTHQLKAPFAAIHANTQLLLGGHCGALPAPAVAVIEQIATRCEMLSRGIKSMLQLANLRSQAQHPPAPVAVDLAALIQSCLAALKPQAAKRGIEFEEQLSPAPVQVVPDHAAMIIDNILSNAINYSRDGQRISVSSRAKADGGAAVVVRDRGIGIPPDKLPRIFDDYFRTTEAVKHNRASTGLGLAIVRQSALSGAIGVRVESAAGQGTVFFLDFPRSPDHLETTN